MPAPNERFGASGGEVQTLKGSAYFPRLRQAAIPLCASATTTSSRERYLEKSVQPDNDVET